VDELIGAYQDAKDNYYQGGLRLSAVEGGRFAESAFRMLQHQATGAHTAIGTQIDADRISRELANVAVGDQPDSIRLHIPRALRVVYDIRNNRDAAHLADGIDPNVQDATLVIGLLDWVVAEFLRLHHGVSASEAQAIVEDLVTRRSPVIQDFDGFLKVLRTDLPARERILVLLHQRGGIGAVYEELSAWVHPSMRKNLRRTLTGLVQDKAWAHVDGDRIRITRTGRDEVDVHGWAR
jgi:hypothetical protein